MNAPHRIDDSEVRFVNQAELCAQLNISERALKRVMPAYVRAGFPDKDPILEKWFWPEVRQFLFQRHNVSATMNEAGDAKEEDWSE